MCIAQTVIGHNRKINMILFSVENKFDVSSQQWCGVCVMMCIAQTVIGHNRKINMICFQLKINSTFHHSNKNTVWCICVRMLKHIYQFLHSNHTHTHTHTQYACIHAVFFFFSNIYMHTCQCLSVSLRTYDAFHGRLKSNRSTRVRWCNQNPSNQVHSIE
jgi:hypothetical protein